MEISKDIVYVGVNDKNIDLFEGLYEVPNGVSYNSYVILDEKIAIMDTVDANFTEEWLENIKNTLQGRSPDYLITLNGLTTTTAVRICRGNWYKPHLCGYVRGFG